MVFLQFPYEISSQLPLVQKIVSDKDGYDVYDNSEIHITISPSNDFINGFRLLELPETVLYNVIHRMLTDNSLLKSKTQYWTKEHIIINKTWVLLMKKIGVLYNLHKNDEQNLQFTKKSQMEAPLFGKKITYTIYKYPVQYITIKLPRIISKNHLGGEYRPIEDLSESLKAANSYTDTTNIIGYSAYYIIHYNCSRYIILPTNILIDYENHLLKLINNLS